MTTTRRSGMDSTPMTRTCSRSGKIGRMQYDDAAEARHLAMREQFLIKPEVTFLNHGSYGACPRPVFERYQALQLELELQPVEFLGRRLRGMMAEARAALAAYL